MTSHSDFGLALRKAQAESQIPNYELANKLGVGINTISRWRVAKDLKYRNLVRLSAALGLSVDEFIEMGK